MWLAGLEYVVCLTALLKVRIASVGIIWQVLTICYKEVALNVCHLTGRSARDLSTHCCVSSAERWWLADGKDKNLSEGLPQISKKKWKFCCVLVLWQMLYVCICCRIIMTCSWKLKEIKPLLTKSFSSRSLWEVWKRGTRKTKTEEEQTQNTNKVWYVSVCFVYQN